MTTIISRIMIVVVLPPPLEPVLVFSFSTDSELPWAVLTVSCGEVFWVVSPLVSCVLVFVLVLGLVPCEVVPVV